MAMKLTIMHPNQTIEHMIVWLEVITPQGSFIIQKEHIPTVFTLIPGSSLSFCLKNGKQESLHITQGVVEITRTSARALLSNLL